MKVTLYGIPTCQSCKKAQSWLRDQGHAFTWVDVRETPPSSKQIAGWVASLGSKALRNTSGGAYRALGPEKQAWDDSAWVDAFAADPMLIKRPVVEIDGEAQAVGFKPTLLAALF